MAQFDLIKVARHWLQDLSQSTVVQDDDYKWKTWQLVDYANWAIDQACLRSRLIFDESDTDNLTSYQVAADQNTIQLHPSVLFITEVRLWKEDPDNPGQFTIPVQWKLLKRSAGYLNSERFNWELTTAKPYEWMQYSGSALTLGHRAQDPYKVRIKCYRYQTKQFTVLARPWANSTQQYVGDYRTHTAAAHQVRCVQEGITGGRGTDVGHQRRGSGNHRWRGDLGIRGRIRADPGDTASVLAGSAFRHCRAGLRHAGRRGGKQPPGDRQRDEVRGALRFAG